MKCYLIGKFMDESYMLVLIRKPLKENRGEGLLTYEKQVILLQ